MRIIVLGYIVRGPLGGHAWHHLHYVAGLAAMGHDVWFLEDSDDYPGCYDPEKDITSADASYGLAFAQAAFERIGLPDRWAYYDAHTAAWTGPAGARALQLCRSAEIVVNVSGANPLRPWLHNIGTRVYIDTDPGFTQAEVLLKEEVRERVSQHNRHFTFAEQFGGIAVMPDDSVDWIPTRQPVALALWPRGEGRPDGAFSTVMLWDSYPALEVAGMRLGLKSESFGPYMDLPAACSSPLEVALGGSSAPREELSARGWRVLDSRVPTKTLRSYEEYIRSSKGEFSIAKHGYVSTSSGWFSERSANYLATGRPVITQDTGFSEHLPTGEGLLAFSTPAEAAAALAAVTDSYELHCDAARAIAESCFDSTVVLQRLLTLATENSG